MFKSIFPNIEKYSSLTRKLAAIAALVPVQHESCTSVRGRPHLSRTGNAQLRAKLYMVTIVATRHNPDDRSQYLRLLEHGKCKISEPGASMRKLVQVCFGVLNTRYPICLKWPKYHLRGCEGDGIYTDE